MPLIMGFCSCSLALCLAVLIQLAVPARADSVVVRLYVFSSPECNHCEIVQKPSLDALAAKLGCSIDAKYFDIGEVSNYRKLISLEDKYSDKDHDVPVVFIGSDVLGGETELKAGLDATIAKYVKTGIAWPDEITLVNTQENSSAQEAKAVSQQPVKPSSANREVAPSASNIPSQSSKPTHPINTAEVHLTPTRLSRQVEQLPAPTQQVSASQALPVIEQPNQQHPKLYLAFFYETTCRECQRIFYLMNYLKQTQPDLIIKEFNLADRNNKILNEAIAIKLGVPEQKRLVDATVFIGNDYLQLNEVTRQNIERLLKKYQSAGTSCPWQLTPQELTNGEQAITGRFNNLAPLTVAVAGLIDGINPCAFTTLVFFISYLSLTGRKRREILATGISFTAAVYIAYFLVGCGAFGFLKYLTVSRTVSLLINGSVALLAFGFGLISFRDFLKARQGAYKDITLQLPAILKRKIHQAIRTNMVASQYILAAFISGLVVSVLELACTGQVYLPTITFVASQSSMRSIGIRYLLLYNLLFIMPLLIVFLLAYKGTTSQRLAEISKRNIAFAKLGTAMLFIAMGCFLLHSMLA